MTPLLPGFQDQLEARAEGLARRRPVRPGRSRLRGLHGRGLVAAVLVGGLGAGGVAYAAKQIWAPQLGDPARGGEATASTSPVPPEQLALLGVLRRPQTAADRGRETEDALRFQMKEMAGIRLGSVRRLGTTAAGGAIVLLPVATARSMDPGYIDDRQDALCLWVSMPEGGGGQGCSSIADLRAGRIGMSSWGPPPEVLRRQRARMAREQRRQEAEARRRGMTLTEYLNERNRVRERRAREAGRGSQTSERIRIRPEDTKNYVADVVQVVPDGVAQVRYHLGGRTIIRPVRDNVVVVHVDPASKPGLGFAWLDVEGHELHKGRRFPARKT